MKYNRKSDKFLETLYKDFNAVTPQQKFDVMESALAQFGYSKSSFSHNPTIEQKLAMVEMEVLNQHGLYEFLMT